MSTKSFKFSIFIRNDVKLEIRSFVMSFKSGAMGSGVLQTLIAEGTKG